MASSNSCSELPIQWVVSSLYVDGVTADLVQNDGNATYVNGQSGVGAAISTCGTEDAVITLSGSKRAVSFDFSAPLYTNQYTPGGLTGTSVAALSVNIRNVLYQHSPGAEYTFTTRMGANLNNIGPFRMVNLASEAIPPGDGNDNIANTPYSDALVYVHHCPKASAASGGCPALAHETWYVYPDTTTYGESAYTGLSVARTGTLILTEKKDTVNGGEYSMPFYFVISLLN